MIKYREILNYNFYGSLQKIIGIIDMILPLTTES